MTTTAREQPQGTQPSRPAAAWDQCLKLLGSNKDEEKLVGLLLVTKLLPEGSDDAIRQVLEAAGFQFLQRLLLPLSARHQRPQPAASAGAAGAEAEALQRDTFACCLGLAILGSAARLEAVAAGADLLPLLPLLVLVVEGGGVAPALSAAAAAQLTAATGAPDGDADGAAPEDAASASAVADALECLLMAATASATAAGVILQHGGLAAAATALERSAGRLPPAAAAASGTLDGDGDGDGTAGPAVAAAALQRAALLSAQLLGRLLGEHARHQQQHQQQQQASTGGDTATPGEPRLDREGASGIVALVRALGGDAAGAPGRAADGTVMLQLEALHALALALPPLRDSAVARALHARGVAGDGWPAAVRRGLWLLLRTRAGRVQQERSALLVAAECAHLLGPMWLLQPCGPPDAGARAAAAAGGAPGALASALLRALSVEMPLLLSDAMDPEALVSDLEARSHARGDAAGAGQHGASFGNGGVPEGSRASADADAGAVAAAGGSSDAPGCAPQDSRQQQQQQQQQRRQQRAGERALAGLPPCFMLMEALLEALAQDADTKELLLDSSSSESHTDAQQQGLALCNDLQLPMLDDAAAAKLLTALLELGKVLLDFLQHAQSEGGPRALTDPLVFGAVRLVSFVQANVPGALDDALAPLLPFLLQVASPDDPDTGAVPFFEPLFVGWMLDSEELGAAAPAPPWLGPVLACPPALQAIVGTVTGVVAAAAQLAELRTGAAGAAASAGGDAATAQGGPREDPGHIQSEESLHAASAAPSTPLQEAEDRLVSWCRFLLALLQRGARASGDGGEPLAKLCRLQLVPAALQWLRARRAQAGAAWEGPMRAAAVDAPAAVVAALTGVRFDPVDGMAVAALCAWVVTPAAGGAAMRREAMDALVWALGVGVACRMVADGELGPVAGWSREALAAVEAQAQGTGTWWSALLECAGRAALGAPDALGAALRRAVWARRLAAGPPAGSYLWEVLHASPGLQRVVDLVAL